MRVLQISKFYPPVHGGIESTVRELAEGLQRAGTTTDVLCAHRQHLTEVSVVEGVEVTRAGSLGVLLSTSMSPAMIRILRRRADAYDILHVHMPDPMAALALRAASATAPLVVHWHSDVIRQRSALHLYRPLQDWLLRRCDAIVATSADYADASAPLAPWRAKVHVVPIGIGDNRSRVNEARVAALRRQHPRCRIVFALGRMAYYKGFDVLVDAAASLPEDVKVWIGGSGECSQALAAQVSARGLGDRVQLIGAVPDDELADRFAACDVFCLPSTARAEAFGVVMLEAMAMGKPVVSTTIPGSGVPWVNQDGETGLHVPMRDPVALAQGLRRLLADDPLRKRLGDGARRRYLQEFTADIMTAHIQGLYRQLLDHRRINGTDA